MLEDIWVNRENTARPSVRNMTYLITSCYIGFISYCIVFTSFLKYSNVNKTEKQSYMILRKGWRYQRGNHEDLKTWFLKSVFENNIYKLHTFLFLLRKKYQNQKWNDAILEMYFYRFWKLSTWIIVVTSNVFEQFCVLFKLIFNCLCIYYSMFSSITLYSQVPDVRNWPRTCYKTFLIRFKITLSSFLLLIPLTYSWDCILMCRKI